MPCSVFDNITVLSGAEEPGGTALQPGPFLFFPNLADFVLISSAHLVLISSAHACTCMYNYVPVHVHMHMSCPTTCTAA